MNTPTSVNPTPDQQGQQGTFPLAAGSGVQRTTATWTLELNCECPHCKEWVDLLHYADFWDAHSGSLDVCEHGTKRSNGVEVTCPECCKDFEVDCEY